MTLTATFRNPRAARLAHQLGHEAGDGPACECCGVAFTFERGEYGSPDCFEPRCACEPIECTECGATIDACVGCHGCARLNLTATMLAVTARVSARRAA